MDITENYHGGADTSIAAFRSLPENYKTSLRQEILDKIFEFGEATCNEVQLAIQKTHQTVSPRFAELRRKGSIVDTGERRNTIYGRKARVYRLHPLLEIQYELSKEMDGFMKGFDAKKSTDCGST